MPLCRGNCRSEGIQALYKHLLSGKSFWTLEPAQFLQPLYIYLCEVWFLYDWEERESRMAVVAVDKHNIILFCSDKAERKGDVVSKRTETAGFILLFSLGMIFSFPSF